MRRGTMRVSKRIALVLALIMIASVTSGVLIGCKKKAVPPKKVEQNTPVKPEPEPTPPPEPIKYPYTGLDAPSKADTLKRPLSVKIENSNVARPQMGLASADVVYETETEGGITRFNCIFQSEIPKQVGPVRSARYSDLWVIPQYDGIFFFSGSKSALRKKIKASNDELSHSTASKLYKRVSFRRAPHNLYLDLSKAYGVAEAKGYAITSERIGLQFGEPAVNPVQNATELKIPFSSYATIEWKYDAEAGIYRRSNNGKKHLDSSGDKRITAENVVVMWADYSRMKGVDAVGSTTYDINLGGTGTGAIFKDGNRVDVTWTAKRKTPPTFKDATGNEVTLNPGKTWFEVPMTKVKITSSGPATPQQ